MAKMDKNLTGKWISGSVFSNPEMSLKQGYILGPDLKSLMELFK